MFRAIEELGHGDVYGKVEYTRACSIFEGSVTQEVEGYENRVSVDVGFMNTRVLTEYTYPMIDELRSKIATNHFEFSKHALDQSILRGITVQELREAILDGDR